MSGVCLAEAIPKSSRDRWRRKLSHVLPAEPDPAEDPRACSLDEGFPRDLSGCLSEPLLPSRNRRLRVSSILYPRAIMAEGGQTGFVPGCEQPAGPCTCTH